MALTLDPGRPAGPQLPRLLSLNRNVAECVAELQLGA